MPRHHEVGVSRQAHELGGDPTRLEVVELLDQHLRVDDAAGADHALLALQDPGRDVLELVGLAVHDDRVAGIRAAVVAADEIGVPREQVDDLALPLVTPLRAHHYGRRHRPDSLLAAPYGTKEGNPTFRFEFVWS